MSGAFDKPPARVIKFNPDAYHKNRLPGRPALGAPAMSDPATPETTPAPISPTGKPVLPQVLAIVMTVLAAAAAVVTSLATGGIALPAWVAPIAGAITAICAAFGIASPGLRTDAQK